MRSRTTMLTLGAIAVLATAVPASADDAARGERVYARFCATCHGASGDGRGVTAVRYGGPRPRDFTFGKYKYRTTEGGKLPLRTDLVRTIERGIPDTTMPAWRRVLAPRDIDAVAAYVEGFSPRFVAEPEATRTPVTIPAEMPWPITPDKRETGRLLFIALRCWECHGEGGRGDGPASPTLVDDWKLPIRPADLTRGRYRSGPAPSDLYRTLATGLDGTPMPTYRLAVVVGREGLADLGEHAGKLDPRTHKRVTDFVARLPSQDRIDALSDAQREQVAEQRLWLLVGYVRSLQRPPGALDWLLWNDPQAPR